MTNYLVTGGAGFIGSNIVQELVARGEAVRVLDNFSTGKRENIARFLEDIELIEGDLRHLDTVRQATEGVDYILHQGAIPSVPRSIDNPLDTDESNVRGTLNLLVAARDAGVKRVVHASSSAVYGDTPALPKTEEMKPAPLSPYAVSKLAGEHYCRVFYQVYGLETVALRYFNVFGPRQDPTSQYAAVIPKFVTAMLRGEQPVIYGDGEQSRDFSYVTNVVQANLLAATAPVVGGQVFNIACGQRYNLLELVATINRILGTDITPVHTAPRVGDVRHSLANIARARGMLGYQAEVKFEEGLRRLIAWYKGHEGQN
ncbi:MAG: SDR family oxidoreductase [Anaerolineales bacterium]|nr:MAG: SDR family oxidoreductase [Anaerolineales bacterium]